MNKIRDRWRFVAESWFALSAEDQMEALAVAAAESGWLAFLLEKDIWVVWALQILTAMADSGRLRGDFPSFPELRARISQLEVQCNAIARSFA